MNSSAKFTGFWFVAAAALGAAAWIGCTTSSSTSDISDGGVPPATPPTTTPPPTSNGDGGSDGGNGEVCGAEFNFTGDNAGSVEPACMTCLSNQCCTELRACTSQPFSGSNTYSCHDYFTCVNECAPEGATQEEIDQCVIDTCDLAAGDAAATYKTERQKLQDCALDTNRCAADCGG